MARWRAGWFLRRSGRSRWTRGFALVASVALGLQLMQAGLLVPGAGPQAALALTPVSPPAPVNPAPKVADVTTAGPTQVSGTLTTDTVWSAQGSPYMVNGLTIPAGVELTLLPGTVVKIGSRQSINVDGVLLSLGDPGNHVVITSYRDDSIMGDSDGDGGANPPAPGDWDEIFTASGGESVFDYTDVRYGGRGSSCHADGELATYEQSEMIVSNSSVTDSASADIDVTYQPSVGIYNSSLGAGSCIGVAASQPGDLDITGNTFDMPAGNTALFILAPQKTRVWFNTVNGLSTVAGSDPTTQAMADVRFNQLGGIYDYGAASENLNDWSDNWWGFNANSPLPACMDPDVAASSVPAISVSGSSAGCPSGQYQVTGYAYSVLPALSASPQVLPEALREAAAPRFGPVDTYSGALTYQADDMDVQDAGQVIAATRAYRSDRLSGGDAGTGWTTAFDESLSASGGTSTLSLPDGSSIGFATDPAAGYTPAPGVSAGFTTGGSGSTVTSPNQVSYQFDPSGELTGINLGDPGHHLTVDHSGGQVSNVTGVSGRYLSYNRASGQLTSITDGSGREVDFSYSGSQLSSVTGVDGNTETYSYDSAGHLTQVTAPSGLVKLAAGYDSDGRVAWIQQEGGGRTTFTYDDADGKRLITLADGTVITQLYDWAGRLVSEQLGSTGTHVVYDGEGHVVASITGVPDVAMTGYGPSATVTMYDGQGDPYLSADPMGNVTTTTFNSQHQPLVTTGPDGTTASRTYDDDGRLVQLTDPRGKTWAYTYNSFGEVTSQTDPLGRTRTVTYAGNGDATSVTDETGAATQFGYNSEGWRTSVTDPLGNETDTTCTPWGAVRTVTSPLGGVTTVTYNADRKEVSVTNPLGGITSYGYDSQGRLASTTDPQGGQSTIQYDMLGRPVHVTDARGSTYQRTYTPEGWVATSTDPDGQETSYAYDPAGRAIRVTDPMGAVTQTVYDRNGNVIEVDRPDGSAQTWTYNDMNRLAQYTLPDGGEQQYTYDASGNLTSVLGPRVSGITLQGTTATYDAAGRLASTTDATGTTTTYTYDDTSRTVTATDPLGQVRKVGYNAAGRVISRADGADSTTSYGYDADGNLTSVTDPDGRTTTYAYDLNHQLISATTPAGLITSYAYDTDGRVTTITYPAGDTQTYQYDPAGNLVSYRDRDGNHWTCTYDDAGHQLTATDPLGSTTTYTYDADGRQSSVTDPAGVVTHTAYDPAGRPAVTWDATGASWVTTYDKDGNLTSQTDPDGVSQTYTYNTADQLTRSQRSGMTSYSYSYDADGRLTQKSDPYTTSYSYDVRGQVTKTTDALGNTTAYGYDGAGRLLSATLPGGQTSSVTYDDAGQILTATDGAGDTSHYAYTAGGQLASLTLPRGGIYSYTYDPDGRPATQTDPLGNTTSYLFDGQGQLTSVTYPSGRTVTSAYDAAGRLTSTSAGAITRSFGYDAAGRLTSATVTGQPGSPPALSWGYDNRGLMTSSTGALGTTTYAYDAAGRLTTRAPPSGTPATFGYNASGLPSTISGPVSITLGYNNAGQMIYEWGGLDNLSFTYDKDGHLTGTGPASATYNSDGQVATLTQNPPGNAADNTTTYAYDNAGRLSSAALSQNGTTVSTTTYGWDADSNRTSTATTGQPAITTSYNLADQPATDSSGTSYSYDPDGNLTSVATPYGSTSYSYGPFGDLTGVTTASGGTVGYTPDALGRAAARTSGTTQTFSYDGTTTSLAAQQASGTTTNLIRDPGGQLLAEATVGGTVLRAVPTIHGDIAQLVSPSTGTTAWTAVYDPFGNATTTGTAPVSVGFQSMPTDPLTGLVDMGARSYDPATGTFTSLDTITGVLDSPPALNRYLYGNGDPADSFDPTGYFSWSGLWGDVTGWFSQQWDNLTSAVSQAPDSATSAGGQILNGFTQAIDTVQSDLPAVLHNAAQVARAYLPAIKATAASVTVGGLVFLGCEALTAGAGSLGCATAGGAAGGAIYNSMMCPPAAATTHCALTGALAGGLAGLTGSITAEAGAGALAIGAAASATGNTATQLLDTGHIDPRQLAAATLTGAALIYAAGKLPGQPAPATLTDDTQTTPTTTSPADPTTETNPATQTPPQPQPAPDTLPPPAPGHEPAPDTRNWPNQPNTAPEDAGADAADAGASRGPSFIANSNGEVIRVPEGATGPEPAESRRGFQFTGGSGGAPLDSRVAGVRVMDPGYSGKYFYPNGYVSYFNEAGQTVNPFTGQTIARSDPFWHWEWGS